MLNQAGKTLPLGREARIARTGGGRSIRNALALPIGSIIVIDELGRPLKQLVLQISVNEKPLQKARTDDFGRIYPLVAEIDEVTIQVEEAHEAGRGDSIVTGSGSHFERGGNGPR